MKLALLQAARLTHFCEQDNKEAAFPSQMVFPSDRKEFFLILKKAPCCSAVIDTGKNNMKTAVPRSICEENRWTGIELSNEMKVKRMANLS